MKKLILFLLVTSSLFSYSLPPISVGIIGTAVNGWEVDVDMATTDGINFTLANYALQNGELKFRENDDWTVNWGSTDFPNGTGVQNGENISVTAGKYDISFNKETGNYSFIIKPECICTEEYNPVCANDTTYSNPCHAECQGIYFYSMGECETEKISVFINGDNFEKKELRQGGSGFYVYNENFFESHINLPSGEYFFEVHRGNSITKFSGDEFPKGKATESHEQNIVVKSGEYSVSFFINSGNYDFVPTPEVYIAGKKLTQVDNQGNYEAKNVSFEFGNLTIHDNPIGNDGIELFVGSTFPNGTRTYDGESSAATVPQGQYNIYYNTISTKYRFEKIDCICPAVYMPVCVDGVIYGNSCEAQCAGHTEWSEGSCTTIRLFGSSLEEAVKLNRGGIGMVYDPDLYSTTISVDDGEFYFEITNWDAVSHYAAPDFPNGTAKLDYDTKIPVKEGTFIVTYNSKTNAYSFDSKFQVSISGQELSQIDSNGNYEVKNAVFESNLPLTIQVTELKPSELYNGNNILIAKYDMPFPSGIATLKPQNEYLDEFMLLDYNPVVTSIPSGTYDISYNVNTKKYSFEEPSLSTTDFDISVFTVWPNPVNSGTINISEELSNVQLFDIHGRLLFSKKQTRQLDVTGLDAGTYFLSSGNKTIKISIQ